MKHGENMVITGDAVIIWDGVTSPENQRGSDGSQFQQYNLSVAMPNNAPEVAELQEILTLELNNGEFKGNFPNGGHWGIKPVETHKFEGRLPAHVAIKGVSYRPVQVFDANGNELSAMTYGPMLYPGAVVRLLVAARSYNNVSKGVGFWLSGIQIVDPTAPRLPVGGVDAGAAFGAVPVQGAPAPGGYPPQTAAPGAPPAGYPPQTAAPGAPPAGYPPQTAAPGAPIEPHPQFLNPPNGQPPQG